MPPTLFNLEFLIIAGLATYYVTHAMIATDGPWEIFARLRDRVGVRFDKDSVPYAENQLAKIFLCPVCFSLYPALFFVFWFLLLPSLALVLMLPLAVAGLTVALGKL